MSDLVHEPILKPCPFCGQPGEFDYDPGEWGYKSPNVRVRCTTCWVETPKSNTEAWAKGIGHYTVEAIAYYEVAELWNSRALQDIHDMRSVEITPEAWGRVKKGNVR